MKSKKQPFFLFILVLSLTAFACNFGSSGTTTDTTPDGPQVLFQDDFSSKGNDWLELRDADGITDYDQDGYRIKVDKAEWIFWSTPGISLMDMKIDVDATKLGGPEENEFGVICRYVDDDNFYFFTITSDGYYSANKIVNGEYEFIGMDEFQTSEAIQAGNTLNHLTVECNGNTVRFSVNGTVLAQAQDDTFTVGDVGLIAGTSEVQGTDILFDNMIVTEP